MTRVRKALPVQSGAGMLRCRGFKGPVSYEIRGEPASLKLGPARLRGSLSASPEIAAQAFRDGDGDLTLENGVSYRITMLGYSSGEGIAYFEMRI